MSTDRDDRYELERYSPAEEAPLTRPGYPRPGPIPETYGYGYPGDSEEVHLRDLWKTIRRRKWMIIVITIIVTTIVTVEAYRTPSKYLASATVEVGRDTTTVKVGQAVIQTDDESGSMYAINTKILLMKSRPLLEDVVVTLRLDENPKFAEVTHRKSFWEAASSIWGNQEANPPEKDKTISSNDTTPLDLDVPRTQEESNRLARFVGLIQSNLSVEQVKDTRALRVSFTHTDPVISSQVANGIARCFVERGFQTKTEKYTNAVAWLDRTTRELKSKVEQSEQALANYSREHNLFTTEGKETLTTDKMSRLHDQALRTETERILKQSLYEEVKAGRVAQLPEAFSDSRTVELQKKLSELMILGAQLDVKYGHDNPKVVEVQKQITAIEDQINSSRKFLEEKLKADYERTIRDEQSIKAALERAKSEAVIQNQAAIQFNILRQDVDTSKSIYTDFLQKTNQAKVQVAEQSNNLRIIEPAATPSGPVGPQRLRTILIGLFISLGAGIGLAFFLEYLDNTIKSVEDVNRFIQLPALGVIPALSSGAPKQLPGGKGGGNTNPLSRSTGLVPTTSGHSSHLVALETRSTAAEAYRVLRTSVLLSAAGNPPKTILVTSGQPGEGKTTTSVNTAISLAQLGARVLIIDCDLRKPSLHKVFNVDHMRGLSTFLSRKVGIEGLIQPLQIPNLSLLPCGPIPPNPAELISSEKMKSLLRLLYDQYDHILIDSPPLMNVTDPVILSTMVDGVILVVHGGKSTRDVVKKARNELMTVGAKIFGVVINNLDIKKEGYNDYYYYRYYSEYGKSDSSDQKGA